MALALGACSTVPDRPPPTEAGPSAGSAPAPAAPPQAADQAAAAEEEGMLETARGSVRSATEWLARSVDSWFGSSRPFDPARAVRNGLLGLRSSWRKDTGADFTVRFDARLDLPNLRDRAFVFLGRDNERDVVTDKPSDLSRQQQLVTETVPEEQSFFAGLGLNLRENIELRAGVRRGYRPYTQARFRKQWLATPRDLIEFRETVFWTVDDGFGSTTVLSADHVYTPSLVLRWLNSATVSQKTNGAAWASNLGLYKHFGELRLLSGEALINGETGRDVGVTDYGLLLKWQQPVYRDWLIGEFIVGRFWPREDAQSARIRTWAFGVGVEMRF